MVTSINTSDKRQSTQISEKYIYQHGVPRRIHVDQGSCFTSKKFQNFCNSEGIEVIYSPVNEFVLTYATEKEIKSLVCMVNKALGELRFSKNATTKLTTFEAHHGREADIILRNLMKRPSLKNPNGSKVLKQKCSEINAMLNHSTQSGQKGKHCGFELKKPCYPKEMSEYSRTKGTV